MSDLVLMGQITAHMTAEALFLIYRTQPKDLQALSNCFVFFCFVFFCFFELKTLFIRDQLLSGQGSK